eukprot:13360035-Ditylum_brightwellii.AAC.1
MLKGRAATYGSIVCDHRPQKADPNQARLVVGGDQVEYPFNVSTPTADLATAKILMNSVISTKCAKFWTMDIKNFYLNTPMKRYKYMQLGYNILPEEIIKQYQLDEMQIADGWVYMEIRKGMYSLPQAGILVNKLLTERLANMGITRYNIHQDCGNTNGV